MNGRPDTGARYLSRGESCGNCRAMETVEKSFKGRGSSLSDFSTSFHSAWKTLRKKQKRGEFSTVPTASTAGYFSRKEPVSSRRYPDMCFAETYSPREGPSVPGKGWLARKQSRSQLRSSLSLTAPFIGLSLRQDGGTALRNPTNAVGGSKTGRHVIGRPSMNDPPTALVGCAPEKRDGQRGESPLRANALRPVANSNCVAARRGGEQQEAND